MASLTCPPHRDTCRDSVDISFFVLTGNIVSACLQQGNQPLVLSFLAELTLTPLAVLGKGEVDGEIMEAHIQYIDPGKRQ
jgi:hypothetical protein